tara:strand:- start:1076 stop:1945 length:870 start_codon:yes stop_codon:yes gene_type:complete
MMSYKDAEKIFKRLHSKAVKAFKSLDENIKVNRSNWKYKEKGGGQSVELSYGKVIEKGAVNFSSISGRIIPGSALSTKIKTKTKSFSATGVSIVIHPENPFVPCSHLNIRYFELGDKSWWVGGGFDLTPYFPFAEDVNYWHKNAKKITDELDKKLYKKFKKDCDEYFYLKHRNEKRGVGGIFFDNLNELPKEDYFTYLSNVMDTYLNSYSQIVEDRKHSKYGKKHKEFQLFRRGRYVEFNLLYDRGTVFGLQSGGRAESILMSLPPNVKWSSNKDKIFKKFEQNLRKFI